MKSGRREGRRSVEDAVPTTWGPARRGLGALALLTAILTGAYVLELGGPGSPLSGAGAYLLLAGLAVFFPAAVAAQVLAGQLMIAGAFLGGNGPAPLTLVPAMAGVIFTAELLAVVARMDTPLDSHPREDLPRAALSGLLGGAVCAAVLLTSRLSGPTGLWAVVLAVGACVLMASALAGRAMTGRVDG